MTLDGTGSLTVTGYVKIDTLPTQSGNIVVSNGGTLGLSSVVYNSCTLINVTSNESVSSGSWTTLKLTGTQTVYDPLNQYNSSTGAITFTNAGYYKLTATVRPNDWGGTYFVTFGIRFYANNSQTVCIDVWTGFNSGQSGDIRGSVVFDGWYYFAAGDYVVLQAYFDSQSGSSMGITAMSVAITPIA